MRAGMMEPKDIRNENWAEIAQRLTESMLRIHKALRLAGPCTTRELSERMGEDPLNVRPTCTKLYQWGMIRLVGKRPTRSGKASQGIYEAVSLWEAKQAADGARARVREERGMRQEQLGL